MENEYDFDKAYASTSAAGRIYLQCIGLLRGDETRAKILAQALMESNNPYFWLMMCFRIPDYETMIAVLINQPK